MRDGQDEHAVRTSIAGGRGVVALLITLLALIAPALAPAAAGAATNLALATEFPASTSLGATGVAGAIRITNKNDTGSITVCNAGEVTGPCVGSTGIRLVPSCEATLFGVCTNPDPGVFAV